MFGLCLNIKPKLAHSQTIFGYSFREFAVIADGEGRRFYLSRREGRSNLLQGFQQLRTS
jgi:hypothetical protein